MEYHIDDPTEAEKEEEQSHICLGVTISYINSMKLNSSKRQSRVLGFKQTVREGWSTREQLQHPTDNIEFKWPFTLPVVSAVVSGKESNSIVWKIEEMTTANEEYLDSDYEKFDIRHKDCNGGAVVKVKEGLCSCCLSKKKLLMERIDNNFEKCNNPIAPTTRNDFLRTISLQQHKTNHWMKRARNLHVKMSYKQQALEKLLEETGVHVHL